MRFGKHVPRINRLVTGRDIIRSCSAPQCCSECNHYSDTPSVLSELESSRKCEHPNTSGKSLAGFPVQDQRPAWCPYHTAVVRS